MIILNSFNETLKLVKFDSRISNDYYFEINPRLMLKLNLFFVVVFFIGSCANDDDKTTAPPLKSVDPPNATGVVYYQSNFNLDETYANLTTALENNKNIGVVAELNHSENAALVDLELPPTQIVFFGNPNLGTPLMQENQLAGLDLPQKILFYKDEDKVFALYNSAKYLASRHKVTKIESLGKISDALNSLVGPAADAQREQTDNQDVDFEEGIISVESTVNFESTYSNLKSSIEANENLSIVAELDHKQNAASVGMELRPTKIIMLGNPGLGTPLMQSIRSLGLDLPQKMLVWEDEEGDVYISYNDPGFLKQKHQLDGNDEEIGIISDALKTLANSAAQVE